MMKLLCVRTGILALLVLSILPSGGCAMMKDKPAAEDLNLVMAGMDGSDGVSFEGAAALLIDGKTVPESSLYYGGKTMDHNQISLYSLLPDGGHPAAAAESGPHPLKQGKGDAPVYYTRMVKEDGRWTRKQASPALDGSNPLEALNPLRQLEELEKVDKKVTEEAGSARGTRVLRIELTAEEARRQLSAELEEKMLAIKPAAPSGAAAPADTRAKAFAAKITLWEQKQAELQQRLNQADIRTVYYLKVDPKRNLPTRLTSNRTLTYPGKAGTSTEETYITQVDFYGYK
ncbi:hypothetical protein MHH28_03430 [Paenibacillus sp. FSL K6-1217]|uniref:hypothetical protein n=1 Tax=Paenibacillus sp. FSL K6-1217 TaxID=2921466 RepID=UPI003250F4C4